MAHLNECLTEHFEGAGDCGRAERFSDRGCFGLVGFEYNLPVFVDKSFVIAGTYVDFQRFAIVVTRFNSLVTEQLVNGAKDCLLRHGVKDEDIVKGVSITLTRAKDWWAKDMKYYRNMYNADKILYRDPIRCHHVACILDEVTRVASDHLPLMVELTTPLRPTSD